VSQAVEIDLEQVVESRSRFTSTVHRPDPDADEPATACPESDIQDREFREVAFRAIASHRSLCQNPECFGGDWR
jgi:hypothetical protein